MNKKVYVVYCADGRFIAVYKSKEQAARVVAEWNARCERGNSMMWMFRYEEVNFFEGGE